LKREKDDSLGVPDHPIWYPKLSPLKRAFRTAEIVAESAGLPKPVAIPDLIERDFGVMTGVPVSEISKRCAPKILKTEIIVYFLEPERGETFPVLKERAARALDQLKSKHRDGSILVVTHGDVGKMLYAEFYNLDWKEVLTQFHFGNSELLLVSKDSPAAEAHVFKTEQHNH